MANTVKMKRSATPGKIPTTTTLALGELAVNTNDGKLFLKKSAGGVDSIVDVTASGAVASVNGYTGIVSLTKSDVGLGSVENAALSTWTGSANIATLGTIGAGTWSGTAIAVAKGGTGASDAATARANLGLAIGTNVQAWSVDLNAIDALAGTSGLLKKTALNTWALDTSTYVPSGGALGTPSSGNLANCTFPTLNQNTTGSAAILTTTRTLTIGSTGKTFNGAANVSWSLAEIGAQAALGFTPVQQGGGTGQGSNKVYIGWSGSQLYLQVDSTNFGAAWPINISGSALSRGSVVSASGAAIDFTGLPAGIKRLVVVGKQLSFNSAGYAAIQIGTSGGIDATGYVWISTNFAGNITSTTRFASAVGGVASYVFDVIWTLYNIGGNDWVCTLNGQESSTYMTLGAGMKTLAGTLDRVRITSTTGTDSFDSGTINIFYEV